MTDRNSPGFTLIEILVVVLIIGLLASVLATNLIGRGQEAQIKLVATQIQKLEASLEMYKLDNGRYPTQEQEGQSDQRSLGHAVPVSIPGRAQHAQL
jgi:general secretion pathway protein G